MSYFTLKGGAEKLYPHKTRIMLERKVRELLTKYSLDEVLREIAQQRPAFHIHMHPSSIAVKMPEVPVVAEKPHHRATARFDPRRRPRPAAGWRDRRQG